MMNGCAPKRSNLALRRRSRPVDLYYPFWSLLADRFDLVVYDFRNHGRNPPSPVGGHDVATFASDNERVFAGIARHFGPKPWTGVFHSVSAFTILHHDPPGAGASALVLFDPPIFPTSGEPLDLDRVPLCGRALDILGEARKLEGDSRWVFTLSDGKPMFEKQLRPGAHGG